MFQKDEQMDDYITPNFHQLKAEGVVVNNPAVYELVEVQRDGFGEYTSTNLSSGSVDVCSGPGSLTQWHTDRVAVPPILTKDVPDALYDKLRHQCLARVDSTPYSFAEDLFELRETLNFLRNPLGSIRDLSKSFSKDVKRLTTRKKSLKRAQAISSVWLSYRFAFSPLVRSVCDLIEARTAEIVRPPRRTARASETFTDHVSEYTQTGPYKFYQSASFEANLKAGLLYTVSNPVVDWRFRYGLRFKDIPTTLWAVFPYSFMVDRVVNLTDTFKGLINLSDPSVEILAGWVTTKRDHQYSISLREQEQSGYSIIISPDTDRTKSFLYEREVWSPSYSDTIPNHGILGLVDDSVKVVDLLTLITQNLK
jgi:hypothetical protein